MKYGSIAFFFPFFFLFQAALKAAAQTHGGRSEEISGLQMEAEVLGTFIVYIYPSYSLTFCVLLYFSVAESFIWDSCHSNWLFFKIWIRLQEMRQQLPWSSSMKLTTKLSHFEQWLREWYWHKKRWFVFSLLITQIFSLCTLLFVMVVLVVNCYLRKRLFLKGVGSLGIGVYVFNMVNSLNFWLLKT